MKIIYTKQATKDAKKIKDQKLILRITRIVTELKNANSINEISAVKKISGNPFAYRIRIGDYRMGVILKDKDTLEILRILKREDIYKVFP